MVADRLAKLAFIFTLVPVFYTGCDKKPQRIGVPDYGADAGSSALAAYDTNKDSRIGGDEFLKTPALKSAITKIDGNKDNAVSAEEIDARIREWRESKVGLMQVACHVQLDGMPLTNAKVVFDPEPFLGSALKQATGQTAQDGTAVMSLAKEHLPNPGGTGVACGWYKIRVTCDQQPIPARYNSDTTLGCEVAIDAVWASEGVVKVILTSN